MNAHDFILELNKRYPSMTASASDDIKDLIASLDGVDLDRLWQEFIDTFDQVSPPRRATFNTLMGRLGMYRRQNDVGEFFRLCKRCNVGFPYVTAICPSCGDEITAITKSDRIPDRFIHLHDSCTSCERFVPEFTEGANCPLWGKSHDRWGLSPSEYAKQIERCKACECRICCREQRLFSSNPSLHKEMSKKGDFVGGYIPKKDK